jgi:tetratricopeptide (TPR) repeat protein
LEQFGKYTLLRRVGSGGMAEVFLARTQVAQGLTKTLVIKKIHAAYARSKQFVAMFAGEAKIALGLNHPNIIQVFDFGAVGDTYFLAMEYVEGMDLLVLLQEAAKARVRLPYGLSAYVVQQLAKGLDYAHRKTDELGEPLGIVHRDISPQNILLSWDGGVKIVDFGIARARDVHEEQGVIKGKFAYMSPEQARGEAVDCRSDVFAAGIVLFELVCARPLFHGKTKDVLEVFRAGALPRPRDHAPALPESLESILLRALAFDRAERYQTARDLQQDLGRFQLEWAQRTGALTDSGVLAQHLAALGAAHRAAAARPLADGAPAGDPPAEVGPPARAAAAAMGGALRPGAGAAPAPAPAPPPAAAVPPAPTAPARDQPRDAAPAAARERRYVYVLEGLLRGTAALERRLGAVGAARVVREFHQVARGIAFKHDALLDARDVRPSDDGPMLASGSAIRAVVGLPIASEDDASRALALALALVDALDGIGSDVEPELRLALAVQRGVVIAPRADAPPAAGGGGALFEIEEATALFAHQLARQARGAEILVGGRVFRAARGDWSFEALPAINLPDDSAPVRAVSGAGDDDTDPGVKRARVYRLRGPKPRAQRLHERRTTGRLYGRELELKALRDAWRDVLVAGRKRQMVIVGDAGVGKRTLVRAFLERLGAAEAVVVRTSGRVGTAMTPYGLIADLARDLLGLAEDAEPREVERRLRRALPLIFPGEEAASPEARTALGVLGRLLGAPPGTAADLDAPARRQALLQLLDRVERRLVPERPLIVLAEDVHWTDQDSQELFAALLRVASPRPVLALMTSRPEPRILRLARDLGTEVVLLDELAPAARRDLLVERFVPGSDLDELVDQLTARAGGNAFFLQELLDTLIERGVVVADPPTGEWPGLLRWVQRDAPIHVPSTIEDLILTRIDGLAPLEREAITHAAVLGRHVSAPALEALIGRPMSSILDDLVRRGLLTPADGEYRFKNDMTMAVAYGLVLAPQRAQLHRAAAARIAGAAGYRPGQDDALIARHLELAGDGSPAAERYLRAAQHAIELGGNADALRQLARALKLLPAGEHGRRFEAHRLRAEVLRRLARRPQQLRELHALRREAEALADPARLAQAQCALAQLYLDLGKGPAAQRAAAPALQFARDSGQVLLEAEALRIRAAVARLEGDAEESLRLVGEALELCERLALATEASRPPTPVLLARAQCLNQRGATLWSMGRLEDSIESYAEELVIYRAIGAPRREARALGHMGTVLAALGEYEEALAHFKSALKLDQELGDRSGVAHKLGAIGQCYSDVGDTAHAETYLAKALAVAEQTGELSTAADAAVSWGQTKLQRGELAAARALFERGLAHATESRERYHEVRALQYLALAHLAGGEPPEAALELARPATAWARQMPMLVGIIYGLAFEALALSRLGRHAEAVAAIDEAVRHLERGRPEGAEYVHAWHAAVLTAAGQPQAAAEAVARATAETATKAARLRDPELRAHFLASRRALVVRSPDALPGVGLAAAAADPAPAAADPAPGLEPLDP